MPQAARPGDTTGHGPPLSPGPGCPTVNIGFMPAWRALPSAMASAVEGISNAMNSFMTRPQMTPADATASLAQISQALVQGGAAAAASGAPGAAATAGSMVGTLTTANVALTTTWTAASVVPGGQPAANIAYTEGIKAATAAAASAVMSAMAGISDMHVCPVLVPAPPHGPGFVTRGSSTVNIGNLPAARQGDRVFEACGGPDPIAMGCPTVLIGDTGGGGSSGAGGGAGAGAGAGGAAVAPPITDQQTIDQAIALIEAGDFGKTEEGKKVLANIYKLNREGKINFRNYGDDGTRGEWTGSEINVDQNYNRDPESTASELVHEATHNLNEDENPAAKSKNTIDEEMRTNENQLDLYEEQRDRGYRDPELERRRRARADGTLRDDVRGRYPELGEHL